MRLSAVRRLGLIAATILALIGAKPGHGREYFLAQPEMQKYAVILGGAAANETYQAQFRQWSLGLHDILVRDYAYSPDQITLLLGRGNAGTSKIAGPCRRQTILDTMEKLRRKVQPGDQITIFFFGHGTSDDQDAKFVVVGPDITGADFAVILKDFAEQDIAIVNTTGASYPFCTALAAPGRVVVCATRSAAERYDTIFARFLLEALESHAADRDKNRRVSLFEAFWYVREKVKTWYVDEDRLPSEHPTLGDNGDGLLYTDPDPARNQGRLAQIADIDTLAAFLPYAAANGPNAMVLRRLSARVQALERSVILLRNQKADMTDPDYRRELKSRLIDLARTSRRLKALRADYSQHYPMDE